MATSPPPFAPSFPGPGQGWAHGGCFLFQFWLSFTRWVQRWLGHGWFPPAPPPRARATPRGRGMLSLSAPSCLGRAARRCRGSSGSTAKPTVTCHWVPTNINVMFTARAEVPHGLQAVSSWLRAWREIHKLPGEPGHLPLLLTKRGNSLGLLSIAGKSRQRCINFITAPHRNLFPVGTMWGKGLQRERLSNIQPWKKNNQMPTSWLCKEHGVCQSILNKYEPSFSSK